MLAVSVRNQIPFFSLDTSPNQREPMVEKPINVMLPRFLSNGMGCENAQRGERLRDSLG